MTHRRFLVFASAAIAVLALTNTAHAQGRYDFTIPFSFVAGDTTMAAGRYVFSVNLDESVLTISPYGAKGQTVLLPIEMRMPELRSVNHAQVIFDKMDGRDYVFKLVVPDGDGYVVPVTNPVHH